MEPLGAKVPLTFEAHSRRAERVRPRTPMEETVAAVWRELLQIDEVGLTDDFFVVGGHSMVAAQVVAELEERTGVPLELESFFDLAIVEEVAAELDRLQRQGDDDHGTIVFEGEL